VPFSDFFSGRYSKNHTIFRIIFVAGKAYSLKNQDSLTKITECAFDWLKVLATKNGRVKFIKGI
jgi:DNA-binding winged helix-turn-helix (wHTH) protein